MQKSQPRTTRLASADDLRSGVTRPHRYEPDLNRTYAEMAAHFGCDARTQRSRGRRPLRVVTERAGRSLLITANRAASDWYPLFPNPVVAESILDRLVNSAHHVLMEGRSYRPMRRPGRRGLETDV